MVFNFYFKPFSSIPTVDFEQVNVSWDFSKTLNAITHNCFNK